jgi:hypothetical protein
MYVPGGFLNPVGFNRDISSPCFLPICSATLCGDILPGDNICGESNRFGSGWTGTFGKSDSKLLFKCVEVGDRPKKDLTSAVSRSSNFVGENNENGVDVVSGREDDADNNEGEPNF